MSCYVYFVVLPVGPAFFCLYYLSCAILIILIQVNYFFEKSLMRIRVCHLHRVDKMSLIILRISYVSK